jgi:hypothetical protein
MKYPRPIILIFVLMFGIALPGYAAGLVSNVWNTGVRAYSAIVTNTAGSVFSSNAILTVSPGTPSQPQLSGLIYINDGTFSLTVNGDSGPDYIVQASTNLMDWTSIFTNHSPTLPFVWSDAAAGNFSQRFYRIQLGQ